MAEKLFRNHGLTLQPQKTEILPTDAFHEKYLATPLDKELGSLHEKFDEIIRELGLADLYEPIDPADLSESEKTKIEALNLDKLFVEQIDSKSELDIPQYSNRPGLTIQLHTDHVPRLASGSVRLLLHTPGYQ